VAISNQFGVDHIVVRFSRRRQLDIKITNWAAAADFHE